MHVLHSMRINMFLFLLISVANLRERPLIWCMIYVCSVVLRLRWMVINVQRWRLLPECIACYSWRLDLTGSCDGRKACRYMMIDRCNVFQRGDCGSHCGWESWWCYFWSGWARYIERFRLKHDRPSIRRLLLLLWWWIPVFLYNACSSADAIFIINIAIFLSASFWSVLDRACVMYSCIFTRVAEGTLQSSEHRCVDKYLCTGSDTWWIQFFSPFQEYNVIQRTCIHGRCPSHFYYTPIQDISMEF